MGYEFESGIAGVTTGGGYGNDRRRFGAGLALGVLFDDSKAGSYTGPFGEVLDLQCAHHQRPPPATLFEREKQIVRAAADGITRDLGLSGTRWRIQRADVDPFISWKQDAAGERFKLLDTDRSGGDVFQTRSRFDKCRMQGEFQQLGWRASGHTLDPHPVVGLPDHPALIEAAVSGDRDDREQADVFGGHKKRLPGMPDNSWRA